MFLKKKEQWSTFALKASVFVTALVTSFYWFMGNYRIGIDFQGERCLPEHKVWLIDLNDQRLVKGATYSFHSKGAAPIYTDGTRMLKILAAVPGDKVAVRVDSEHINGVEVVREPQVLVNDTIVARGLIHAKRAQVDYRQFAGESVLTEGRYWFLGTSPLSFDSRYWGTVTSEQIIGRAYAIF